MMYSKSLPFINPIFSRYLLIFLCLSFGVSSLPAFAQLGKSTEAVTLNSLKQEYFKDENKMILEGQVSVQQGIDRLKAKKKITIYYSSEADGGGQGRIKRIEAEKDVTYISPGEIIRGDHAFYDAGRQIIQFTGNVIVIQNRVNVISGYRLTYHLDTEILQMEGKNAQDRVHAIYYPDAEENQKKNLSSKSSSERKKTSGRKKVSQE